VLCQRETKPKKKENIPLGVYELSKLMPSVQCRKSNSDNGVCGRNGQVMSSVLSGLYMEPMAMSASMASRSAPVPATPAGDAWRVVEKELGPAFTT
jgi:hypothetical protein